MDFFFRGFLVGLSIAAAVGPISVLCIQRTLEQGRWYGLVSGLGVATADALYGSIAGFGLTVVMQLLIGQQLWIRLVGGGFLVYLGLKTLLSQPKARAVELREGGMFGAYTSTLGLTLTNPLTILSFVAVFAGLGLGNQEARSYLLAGTLVLGVFLGSALWWILLTTGVGLLRSKLTARTLSWINRFSGAIILIFGVLALGSLRALLYK